MNVRLAPIDRISSALKVNFYNTLEDKWAFVTQTYRDIKRNNANALSSKVIVANPRNLSAMSFHFTNRSKISSRFPIFSFAKDRSAESVVQR